MYSIFCKKKSDHFLLEAQICLLLLGALGKESRVDSSCFAHVRKSLYDLFSSSHVCVFYTVCHVPPSDETVVAWLCSAPRHSYVSLHWLPWCCLCDGRMLFPISFLFIDSLEGRLGPLWRRECGEGRWFCPQGSAWLATALRLPGLELGLRFSLKGDTGGSGLLFSFLGQHNTHCKWDRRVWDWGDLGDV